MSRTLMESWKIKWYSAETRQLHSQNDLFSSLTWTKTARDASQTINLPHSHFWSNVEYIHIHSIWSARDIWFCLAMPVPNFSVQRSAVRVTIGYSDSFCSPQFVSNIMKYLRLDWQSVRVTVLSVPKGVTVTADHCTTGCVPSGRRLGLVD